MLEEHKFGRHFCSNIELEIYCSDHIYEEKMARAIFPIWTDFSSQKASICGKHLSTCHHATFGECSSRLAGSVLSTGHIHGHHTGHEAIHRWKTSSRVRRSVESITKVGRGQVNGKLASTRQQHRSFRRAPTFFSSWVAWQIEFTNRFCVPPLVRNREK